MILAQAQRVAQLRVAPRRLEVAELDAERNDVDLVDAERAQLGRAAILAEGKNRIEAPIEDPAIAVADPPQQPGQATVPITLANGRST